MRAGHRGHRSARGIHEGQADLASERAAQRLGSAEAGATRDLVDAGAGGLEQPARGLDPDPLDVARGPDADLGGEHAAEVADAHRRAPRERGHREVLGRVVDDPRLQIAHRRTIRGGGGELGRELRLAAGAAHEHDQPAGDQQRDLAAEIVLDHREREIDPGGHAGRGPQRTIAHEDRIARDRDRRILRRQPIAVGPVGGDRAVIGEAGGGEHEGPGAHRRDPPGPCRRRARWRGRSSDPRRRAAPRPHPPRSAYRSAAPWPRRSTPAAPPARSRGRSRR